MGVERRNFLKEKIQGYVASRRGREYSIFPQSKKETSRGS
jgi:hypothetical protein